MKSKILLFMGAFFFSSISIAEQTQFKLPDDIQFTGTVVDTSPNWLWRIDTKVTAWGKGWDAERSEGVKKDRITTFSYPKSKPRQALLQGYMKTAASGGRPGIAPIITIQDGNSPGSDYVLDGNTEKQTINLFAKGTSSTGLSVPDGIFSVVIESAFTAFYKERNVPGQYMIAHYRGVIGAAAYGVILEQNNAVTRELYTKFGTRKHAVKDSGYSIYALLQGGIEHQAYDVLGGFTSHMSDIKTRWTTVPSHWNASMVINVRIK